MCICRLRHDYSHSDGEYGHNLSMQVRSALDPAALCPVELAIHHGLTGCFADCRVDQNLDGAAIFNTRVLVGNRNDAMLQLCARQLSEGVLAAGCSRYTPSTDVKLIATILCKVVVYAQGGCSHAMPDFVRVQRRPVMLCLGLKELSMPSVRHIIQQVVQHPVW